jgi:predicted RNA-binding protein
MCELKVVVNDEVMFENAIYAKVEGATVTVRDVLGVTKVFNSYEIVEVDINKERLLLRQIEK